MSDFLADRMGPLLAPQGKRGGSALALVWRGTSPLRLLIRGVAQAAISGFFVVLFVKLSSGEFGELAGQAGGTAWWTVLIGFALVSAALGLAGAVVGLLDLVLGRRVSGRVLSTRERRTGDRLPWWVQPVINRWDEPGTVNRPWFVPRIRRWHEVLLSHPQEGAGVRWTAPLARTNKLRVGSEVELTVGPLLGYVRSVRVLEQPEERPAG